MVQPAVAVNSPLTRAETFRIYVLSVNKRVV